MGNIEKRGKNTWRVGTQVLTDTGWAWVRRTIHLPGTLSEAKQRKEAEKALAKLITEVGEGKASPSTGTTYTVATFAEYWMQQHVEPNLSAVTGKTYRHFLDARIIPMLGDVPLKKLTPTKLTEWINEIRSSPRLSTSLPPDQRKRPTTPSEDSRHAKAKKADVPLSARTVRHYYDTMEAMLDKAVQWEILPSNPMAKVDRPTVKKTHVHYLTEERAVELLRCLKDEPNMCYRVAVLLALLCGLRLGEVGALRLTDIDWEHNTIDISRALKYTPATGNFEGSPKTDAGARLVSLPAGMMDVLREAQKYQEETAKAIGENWVGEGWIVHAWNGAQLHHDTPSKWFRKFADAHGFEGVRFHDLRHTHATMLLANNIDAVAVATRLGHTDASTTLRVYAHALRRRDEDAAKAVQTILDRALHPDQKPE